jgi:hypothetical protein
VAAAGARHLVEASEVREVLRTGQGRGEVRGQVVLQDLVVEADLVAPVGLQHQLPALVVEDLTSEQEGGLLEAEADAVRRLEVLLGPLLERRVRQPGQADPPGLGEAVLRQVLVQVEEAGQVLATDLAAVGHDGEDDRQAGEDGRRLGRGLEHLASWGIRALPAGRLAGSGLAQQPNR